MSTPTAITTGTRTGLAMILAAYRTDHEAAAHLLYDLDRDELQATAVACAVIAVGKCRELGALQPDRDIEADLAAVALHLAGWSLP